MGRKHGHNHVTILFLKSYYISIISNYKYTSVYTWCIMTVTSSNNSAQSEIGRYRSNQPRPAAAPSSRSVESVEPRSLDTALMDGIDSLGSTFLGHHRWDVVTWACLIRKKSQIHAASKQEAHKIRVQQAFDTYKRQQKYLHTYRNDLLQVIEGCQWSSYRHGHALIPDLVQRLVINNIQAAFGVTLSITAWMDCWFERCRITSVVFYLC